MRQQECKGFKCDTSVKMLGGSKQLMNIMLFGSSGVGDAGCGGGRRERKEKGRQDNFSLVAGDKKQGCRQGSALQSIAGMLLNMCIRYPFFLHAQTTTHS